MKNYLFYPEGFDLNNPLNYNNLTCMRRIERRHTNVNFSFVEGFSYPDLNYRDLVEKTSVLYKPEISEIDFSKVKTVSFMLGCTVPRYKATELFKSKGVNVVRDKSKADLVIGNSKSVQHLIVDRLVATRCHILDKDILREFASVTMSNALIDNALIYEDATYWTLPYVQSYMEYILGKRSSDITYWHSQCKNIFAKSDIDAIRSELQLEKSVDEKVLSGLLGELVIDAETCQGIEDLLKSESSDNITMGMKVMTNCNFEKSYFYLMYLTHTYFKEFLRTKENNSVAFKSLKEYLGFSKSNMNRKERLHHIDGIIEAAIQNGMYDDNFMQKIYDIYPAEFNYNKSKYVKPLTFMLTDLGKNL